MKLNVTYFGPAFTRNSEFKLQKLEGMEVEGLIISDLTGGFSGIVRQRGAPPRVQLRLGFGVQESKIS